MSTETARLNFNGIVRAGLLAGGVLLFVGLVKLIEPFAVKDVINGQLSIGRSMIIGLSLVFGYMNASRHDNDNYRHALITGLLGGLVISAMLAIYLVLNSQFALDSVLIHAKPALDTELKFGVEALLPGILTMLVVVTASSVFGAVLHPAAPMVRRPIVNSLTVIILMSLMEDRIITGPLGHDGLPELLRRFLYSGAGLTLQGFISIFIFVSGLSVLWLLKGEGIKQTYNDLPPEKKRTRRIGLWIVFAIFLITLPITLQKGLTEIAVIVGYFMLMGFGLNIVVGFAGLLDLGYVAFFAIAAYVTALLTSTGPFGIAGWTFWQALPVSIFVSVGAGVLLGVPVLRMRGDYLAIVTLGFGEIIKILAFSDLLKPVIGGAQGILTVPKPPNPVANIPLIGGPDTLVGPEQLYYLVLVLLGIAIFISVRVKDSRMGRAWMAIREDETVAEAMGIELVRYKLLAFAIGAGLSGAAGALFATKIGSIFPGSFTLLISINVLALIIVGGMASLPGVVVGALILVGMPELLREFQELRLLLFGALLVVMMLQRPEGFWPEGERKREQVARNLASAEAAD